MRVTRPPFSKMLYERRRELGYTTAQASRILRLKEEILVAFEQGDFDHMPKSGYAQGMLSSYARYLELNPRLVVSQFTQDLAAYQGGVSSMPRRKTADRRSSHPEDGSYEVPRGAQVRAAQERINSGAHGLLPTSGGYAGDLGSFSAVSDVHSRQGYQNPFGTFNPASPAFRGSTGADTGHPYTARQPQASNDPRSARTRGRSNRTRDHVRVDGYGASGEARREAARQAARPRNTYRPRVPIREDEPLPAAQEESRVKRDYVTTRRVAPSQYVDDLRYDDQANPYEAASTRQGRMSSRDIASTRRPNVRRRQSPSTRADLRRREQQQPKREGLIGSIVDFFSDSRRALIFVIVVLSIALTILIISSVKTCVSNFSGDSRSNKVSVSETQTDTSSDSAGSSTSSSSSASDTDSEDSADSSDSNSETTEGSSQTDADNSATTATQVQVSVSVADTEVSWVEITLDGKSVMAETKTGPWSDTYTVTDSIKIEASDPSAVTVTENGEQKDFDKKASGVGTITIKGSGTTSGDSSATASTDVSTDSDSASSATDDSE